MAVKPQPTLMTSLSSEVASEASPLLELITRHAAKIAGALIVFLCFIGAYWFYQGQVRATRLAEQTSLGNVLVIADPAARLVALDAFLAKNDDSTRMEALYAKAESARLAGNQDKAFEAWQEIARRDAKATELATIGMAESRTLQGQYAEALALYETLVPLAKGPYLQKTHSQIVFLAEQTGNIQRALVAGEALVALTSSQQEGAVWVQKVSALTQKLKGEKAE